MRAEVQSYAEQRTAAKTRKGFSCAVAGSY